MLTVCMRKPMYTTTTTTTITITITINTTTTTTNINNNNNRPNGNLARPTSTEPKALTKTTLHKRKQQLRQYSQ